VPADMRLVMTAQSSEIVKDGDGLLYTRGLRGCSVTVENEAFRNEITDWQTRRLQPYGLDRQERSTCVVSSTPRKSSSALSSSLF
jgi:hypothetical protein